MLKVNGKAYDWGDVDLKIPGLNIQVQEISYDDELEIEEVYGSGSKPRGYGTGNYKVACSRKEASCIIGSLLVELAPVCEKCGGLPDGVLNLQTEAGLSLTGDADVLITGHSIISGKPVRIKLTDYGFEYYGDHAELARVREKRCVYHGRAVSPTKEN